MIIKYLIFALTLIIPTLVFFLLSYTYQNKKFMLERIDKRYKSKESFVFSYKKIERFLKNMGANDIAKNISPASYMLFRLIIAVIVLIGLFKYGIMYSIIGCIIAFMVPNWILLVNNRSDNVDMLKDIKKIYDTLRIQMKAGVYITDALRECYLVVKNARLKKALLELNNYIFIERDLTKGLEIFKEKFSNPHINNLCIIIESGSKSGKTVQALSDLSEQIKDIDKASKVKLEETINLRLILNQFAIYIGLMAILVYGIVVSLTSSFMNF